MSRRTTSNPRIAESDEYAVSWLPLDWAINRWIAFFRKRSAHRNR